ncbi:hypothetical protein [Burkholderia cepacia]|uniref:hypothetical protein n=1 Tax=Burkholderia cepacia TaxID=292 RepID=UPI0016513B8E|nr:hypothetical protein [Burkholderia cepacia]
MEGVIVVARRQERVTLFLSGYKLDVNITRVKNRCSTQAIDSNPESIKSVIGMQTQISP